MLSCLVVPKIYIVGCKGSRPSQINLKCVSDKNIRSKFEETNNLNFRVKVMLQKFHTITLEENLYIDEFFLHTLNVYYTNTSTYIIDTLVLCAISLIKHFK